MPSQLPIRGKVARVLNTREVAINKGLKDGVEVGMIFKILHTKGLSIADPDTGEPLGSVELEKVKVKVTIVQEMIAVASTYRTRRVNVGGSGFAFGSVFDPPKWETRVETLEIDEASRVELDEEDSYVRTGDPVVQYFEVAETEI
jgi:hypothetical protein